MAVDVTANLVTFQRSQNPWTEVTVTNFTFASCLEDPEINNADGLQRQGTTDPGGAEENAVKQCSEKTPKMHFMEPGTNKSDKSIFLL